MRRIIIVCLIMLICAGCSGNIGQGEVSESVTPRLGFEDQEMTLNVGTSIKLSLTRGETDQELSFTSGDEAVATMPKERRSVSMHCCTTNF